MSEGEENNVTQKTDSPTETDHDTVTVSLTRKIKERGGHRSTVTRSLSEVEYAIETKNANKLKRLKNTLSDKAALLAVMDREILEVISEDKLEGEIEQSDITRERIEDALMDINEALENMLTRKKSSHHRRHRRVEESESEPFVVNRTEQ